jgi:hypothetical protein
VLNPDGTRNIYERNQENINGKTNDFVNRYIIDKNGNKIPIKNRLT